MKVVDPGHKYALNLLDDEYDLKFLLTFVKREGENYPGNVGHYSGVNIQEVLRALIDRVKYLNNQIKDKRNYVVIDCLRESLWALECRAAERHNRFDRFITDFEMLLIETYPTCNKCGHIGCNGECHEHQ